jgi:branched-chain amino acid transport system ATP-binding protein
MTADRLSCIQLSAWYGPARALFDVTFSLPDGKALGILGRNGAGKSTLLRSIARVHRRISGDIQLGGSSIRGRRAYQVARDGLSLVREGAPVFTQSSVAENLKLGARLATSRGVQPLPEEEVIEMFPALRALLPRRAGDLSGGQRQILALSMALISRPSLVLLDEPSAGLAPEVARSIQLAVSRLCGGGLTVLVAEQNREWLAAVAQSALVLERGRLVNETDL